MILEIINWVQENSAAYFNKGNVEIEKFSGYNETNGDCSNDKYCFGFICTIFTVNINEGI